MTHANSTITPVAKTTFKVGSYNAVTDTFTSVVDLNDRASYWLVSVDLAQPKKVYSRSSTIRAAGETIADWNYQNRHIKVTINLLYGANATALLTAVQTLLAAIENPPYRLAFAAPNTSLLTYAEVVAVTHTIPYDGKLILNGAVKKIVIDFECLPGLPGDRLQLQNLVMNPGFEAPSGPGVTVFTDTFANTDAYTSLFGAAPGVASNLMSIPASSGVLFGSASWGAINTWQVRFKWAANANPAFFLHYTNGSNLLQVFTNGASMEIDHIVGGTSHQLAITSAMTALVAGNFYWVKIMQFPAPAGDAPMVQATLYNDSAGAIGAAVTNGNVGPVQTFDGVTALTGKMGIAVGTGGMTIGGAFANVHTVALFGPGGWLTSDFLGSSSYAPNAYAWEQNSGNTYPGGPVTSFGAARIDIPPAGFYNANWMLGNATSLTTLTQTAIPVAAAGDTLAVSCAYKATGLSANGTVQINALHYNASGAFLSTTFAVGGAKTGSTVGWQTITGTWATPANTAFVVLELVAFNGATAGQDANGTVWFDNVQVWDQTAVGAATGQTTMPYCELRFPQAAAGLMVSGLLGEMKAPAVASVGLFTSSFPLGATAQFMVGRRATPTVGFPLVSVPFKSSTLLPVAGSSGAYGGVLLSGSLSNAGGNTVLTPSPNGYPSLAQAAGIYRLIAQAASSDAVLASTSVRAQTDVYTGAFSNAPGTKLSEGYGAFNQPFAASGAFTLADTGIVAMPPFPVSALADLTKQYPRIDYGYFGSGVTAYNTKVGALLLLPVDAETYVAQIINASNALVALTNQWLYLYLDGATPASVYSIESVSLPNPNNSGGSVGTLSTGAISVNSLADPYLWLDPLTPLPNSGGLGVNEFGLAALDNSNNLFGLAVDVAYTPRYLFPRAA